MPSLQQALQGNDLGFLRMVANAWGIELNAPDAYSAHQTLAQSLRNRALVHEVIEALPVDAWRALQALVNSEGRMTWQLFVRRFGDVRQLGAARRDRERPDLNPTSPAEVLWYRALIGKVFLNLPPEPQEYAFIPDDLVELFPELGTTEGTPLGRPASPGESACILRAADRILDHACTLLAARRAGIDLTMVDTAPWHVPANWLKELLSCAGLLDQRGNPLPDAARNFLEAERGKALVDLAQKWMNSPDFNDLFMLPGLRFDGDWTNNPLQTRQTVLAMLSHLPQSTWWSLPAFISAVKEHQPDYQRPAGDYDSWFIRRENSEAYLRGFDYWEEVDGALLRFMITGPLHWLGIYDLAAPAPGADPSAFRPSAWAEALWPGQPPQGLHVEDGRIHAASNGLLRLGRLTPRAVRYQVARSCAWEGETEDEYLYRLTPDALEQARQKGLQPAHLLGLLRRHATGQIPPMLIQALERWEQAGTQAHLEAQTLLKVGSPAILDALRQTRAARYLGEALNPTMVIVKRGGEEKVREALLEIGYLV